MASAAKAVTKVSSAPAPKSARPLPEAKVARKPVPARVPMPARKSTSPICRSVMLAL